MLVRGKYILTSAEPEEIFDGAFRVKDGVISEIGKWEELNSKFPEDTVYCSPHRSSIETLCYMLGKHPQKCKLNIVVLPLAKE